MSGGDESTLDRVRAIVARTLNVAPQEILEDAPLAGLGLDSLGALEVAFEIEEAFKISIPDQRIAEFTTLRSACAAIDAVRAAQSPAPTP
jgi:acyl carrier protein